MPKKIQHFHRFIIFLKSLRAHTCAKIAQNFLKRNNYRLKKTGFGQIQTQDLCRPRRIRYHHAKRAKDTTNFECIMNQGTIRSPMNPVEKEFTEKSLVPGCNSLAIGRVMISLVGFEDRSVN